MDLKKTENIDWWKLTSESKRESIELGLKDSESEKKMIILKQEKYMKNGLKILWTDNALNELEKKQLNILN